MRRGQFSEGEKELTADDWHQFFAVLRRNIDPLDFSYNVGWWCLKLLWAEAWFKAEKEVPAHGWRMTKESRSLIAREIQRRVAGGQSVREIADGFGVTMSTLRTWRSRYSDVKRALKKRQVGTASKRARVDKKVYR